MKLTAREIADSLKGQLIAGDGSTLLEAVAIDSRRIEPGDLFFAIKGPHHDGHRFVDDAVAGGALGIVVSEPVDVGDGVVSIRVEDTSRALQDLATTIRRLAEMQVVAITGSMGKTTTKEATASALAGSRTVLKTLGNLNNLYGLPLSLLKWRGEQVAVLEMGMSEPGEIARLTEISQPDVGVLTNVAAVHLEFFTSVEEIARAKGELMEGLGADAIAVVNADDPLVLEQARRFAGQQIRFGVSEGATLRARDIETDDHSLRFVVQHGLDEVEVRSTLFGAHNVYNLLAGIGAARALQVPLDEATRGLDELRLPSHRGERHRLSNGAVLIDDTYNSNPAAAHAALAALMRMSGTRHIAVVGDMLELGDGAPAHHRRLGDAAARLGVNRLVAVGQFSSAIVAGAHAAGMSVAQTLCLESVEGLAAELAPQLESGDVVLFKASRSLAMDRVVREILEADQRGGGAS